MPVLLTISRAVAAYHLQRPGRQSDGPDGAYPPHGGGATQDDVLLRGRCSICCTDKLFQGSLDVTELLLMHDNVARGLSAAVCVRGVQPALNATEDRL